MKRALKKEVFFIIVVFAVLFIIFILSRLLSGNRGLSAVITVNGNEYGTYLLSEDQEIKIIDEEKLVNTAVIEDGSIFMKEADCPNHLCISMGRKSEAGSSIVCLPNRVVIRIVSKNESGDYDVITN